MQHGTRNKGNGPLAGKGAVRARRQGGAGLVLARPEGRGADEPKRRSKEMESAALREGCLSPEGEPVPVALRGKGTAIDALSEASSSSRT